MAREVVESWIGFAIVMAVWAALMFALVKFTFLAPHIEYGPTVFESNRELVKCEFDPPISIVVNVMHYYDDYDELNMDYMTATGNLNPVWGYSQCEWQPLKNAAFCDVYTVHPEYVEDDKAMDTIGHETYHGSCGNFHE